MLTTLGENLAGMTQCNPISLGTGLLLSKQSDHFENRKQHAGLPYLYIVETTRSTKTKITPIIIKECLVSVNCITDRGWLDACNKIFSSTLQSLNDNAAQWHVNCWRCQHDNSERSDVTRGWRLTRPELNVTIIIHTYTNYSCNCAVKQWLWMNNQLLSFHSKTTCNKLCRLQVTTQ